LISGGRDLNIDGILISSFLFFQYTEPVVAAEFHMLDMFCGWNSWVIPQVEIDHHDDDGGCKIPVISLSPQILLINPSIVRQFLFLLGSPWRHERNTQTYITWKSICPIFSLPLGITMFTGYMKVKSDIYPNVSLLIPWIMPPCWLVNRCK
jgi:hypothetical protein